MFNKTTRLLKYPFIILFILLSFVWGFATIIYTLDTLFLRYFFAGLFILNTIFVLVSLKIRLLQLKAFSSYLIFFSFLIMWFINLEPSNNRAWQKDVAKLSYATVEENIINIYNIRNFNYKSETDYTPQYYNDSFDSNTLNGVDIICSYWMGPEIAHVFLSFSFEDKNNTNKHLAISIETRKEKNEEYSTIKGFFRQYELYYVVADERDLIGLRTNIRNNPKEDVYRYKIKGDIEDAKTLFLEYVKQINSLKERAQFYNTLTTNCTTTIWTNTFSNSSHLAFNWKILVSGFVPEYLFQNEKLQNESNKSFVELQKDAYVNPLVKNSIIDENFSSIIRVND